MNKPVTCLTCLCWPHDDFAFLEHYRCRWTTRTDRQTERQSWRRSREAERTLTSREPVEAGCTSVTLWSSETVLTQTLSAVFITYVSRRAAIITITLYTDRQTDTNYCSIIIGQQKSFENAARQRSQYL